MDELFDLKIITPERVFYEGRVSYTAFTTVEGQVGIYAGHEALTMLISPGVLHIVTPEGEKKAALHSGFAEVTPTSVNVLAQIAEWPEEIDKNRAEEARIRAERRIREDGSSIRAEMALRRAIARIEALEN